jgi:glucose-1-phosphate thymidylyltransferase
VVRVVGIVPAAGYATRLQPLSCSKEVYPIDGKPVMDYLLERMRAADCDEIRIVTRPKKHDVISNSAKRGAIVVLGHPDSLGESIALGLEGVSDEDVALLGFPDSIWQPVDGFVSLIAALRDDREVALGLFGAALGQPCDAVFLDGRDRVRRIEVKARSARAFWGCAAARVSTLRAVRGWHDPGYFLDALAKRGSVAAIKLSDSYVDIGTRHALDDFVTRGGE